MNNSIIYALDFDGVLCDSAVETAITGWKAAGTIWHDMPSTIPDDKISQFRLIRPIIETGYEAILAMRLLYLEEPIDAIYQDYNAKISVLLNEANISADTLKMLFGHTRDVWIANDLAGWVSMNPLFATIADKLQNLAQQHPWYIITTKQERFVKHILKANAIELKEERIFGLDRNLSKVAVLKELQKNHPNASLYFVEDRLPTLINVAKEPELALIQLVFALWGYNTDNDKALAAQHTFTAQQLDEFLVI